MSKIQVTGNKALVGEGNQKLVLHGVEPCEHMAEDVVFVTQCYIKFKKESANTSYRKIYNRISVVNDVMYISVVSNGANIKLKGANNWLNFAEVLIKVSNIIRKNEEDMIVPAISSWKQESHKELEEVRL